MTTYFQPTTESQPYAALNATALTQDLLTVLEHGVPGVASSPYADVVDALRRVAISPELAPTAKLALLSELKGRNWPRAELFVLALSLVRRRHGPNSDAEHADTAHELMARVYPPDSGIAPWIDDGRPVHEVYKYDPLGRDPYLQASEISGGPRTPWFEFVAKLLGHLAASIYTLAPFTSVREGDVDGQQTLFIQTVHYSQSPLSAYQAITNPELWPTLPILDWLYQDLTWDKNGLQPLEPPDTGRCGIANEIVNLPWFSKPQHIRLQMMTFTDEQSLGCTYSLWPDHIITEPSIVNRSVTVDEGYVVAQEMPSLKQTKCITLKAVKFAPVGTNPMNVPPEWLTNVWGLLYGLAMASALRIGTSYGESALSSGGPDDAPEDAADPAAAALLTTLGEPISNSMNHASEMLSSMAAGSFAPTDVFTGLQECTNNLFTTWSKMVSALMEGWNAVDPNNLADSSENGDPPIMMGWTLRGKTWEGTTPTTFRTRVVLASPLAEETTVSIRTTSVETKNGLREIGAGTSRVIKPDDIAFALSDGDLPTRRKLTLPQGTQTFLVYVDFSHATAPESTSPSNGLPEAAIYHGIVYGEVDGDSKPLPGAASILATGLRPQSSQLAHRAASSHEAPAESRQHDESLDVDQ